MRAAESGMAARWGSRLAASRWEIHVGVAAAPKSYGLTREPGGLSQQGRGWGVGGDRLLRQALMSERQAERRCARRSALSYNVL